MSVEHAVQNQCREEVLRRVAKGREVLAAQILATAEPVFRTRATILVVSLRQQLAAADVEQTPISRSSELQKSAIARECARVPPQTSSGSLEAR